MNGWLGLIQQGLSPCEKRQALLDAPTVFVMPLRSTGGRVWTLPGGRENSKPETARLPEGRGDREASHLPKRSEGVHAVLARFCFTSGRILEVQPLLLLTLLLRT